MTVATIRAAPKSGGNTCVFYSRSTVDVRPQPVKNVVSVVGAVWMLADRLTALKVKHAKPGRHVDGKGLCLVVKPTGAKAWVLRVQVDGKRRDIGLGSTSVITLAEAREKAAQGRKWAKEGLDPAYEWKKLRAVIPSFRKAAEAYHTKHLSSWKNAKHAAQWIQTLREYAFNRIGDMRIDTIEAADVIGVLMPIWLEKPETAMRVRQRVITVLNHAHAERWRPAEAPTKAIAGGLPKRTKTNSKPRKHYAAMPYVNAAMFMRNLRDAEMSVGRRALEFTILTAARSGETRGATWGEIDMLLGTWSIPGERMKAGLPHTVPLSSQAAAVLREMEQLVPSKPTDLIFPGRGGPISGATMTKALKEMGGGVATVHGMRSTFRDWCAERMKHVPGEVAEVALAHLPENKVEAAYRRTMYLEQRAELMMAWGEFLDGEGDRDIALLKGAQRAR
ncbi:tyrosine-type recombinase/integrase [Sphingomonas qomolangmaensis]|uniref:Integrase arm-type DNA-binding domain-containing protein n=1 Tax=Sphingomonas qomolangmaensis TaxID=2918765 RepID=A0ABY5L8Y4_9SPHN|nr:site-specific integrase [Sphingomonas qomolangmaensis]UUL83440.1 integrase arm-type DNA-binding domain-containing protein [Sphingomonas qomolangmaensis]